MGEQRSALVGGGRRSEKVGQDARRSCASSAADADDVHRLRAARDAHRRQRRARGGRAHAGQARRVAVLRRGRRPGQRRRHRGLRGRRLRAARRRRRAGRATTRRCSSRSTRGSRTRASASSRSVDRAARHATEANHTATHLLHAALRARLGDHVRQAGSYVGPDKLRFDFTHTERLSEDERRAVEDDVNALILDNQPVRPITTTLDEARSLGAMALFGEKYGDVVRMVEIGDGACSRELCGGTHVRSTAEIGASEDHERGLERRQRAPHRGGHRARRGRPDARARRAAARRRRRAAHAARGRRRRPSTALRQQAKRRGASRRAPTATSTPASWRRASR